MTGNYLADMLIIFCLFCIEIAILGLIFLLVQSFQDMRYYNEILKQIEKNKEYWYKKVFG